MAQTRRMGMQNGRAELTKAPRFPPHADTPTRRPWVSLTWDYLRRSAWPLQIATAKSPNVPLCDAQSRYRLAHSSAGPRIDTPVVPSHLRSRVRTYSPLLLPTACCQNHAGISERREHALF